jgi:hypothetical protein
MTARDDLLLAIREYEAVLQRSAGLSSTSEPDRREAVRLRRLISERIAAISLAGRKVFQNRPDKNAFDDGFSRMRSAVANHQASWPIVAVDSASADYQLSVVRVREANRTFIEWVRRSMA